MGFDTIDAEREEAKVAPDQKIPPPLIHFAVPISFNPMMLG